MEIIKSNVASIKNNDVTIETRVELSIAKDNDGSYYIITDSGEDCGPHFATQDAAEEAIYDMYGRGGFDVWDLQYA